jgi:TonB-linked SusC/RagA family outer membrane protein
MLFYATPVMAQEKTVSGTVIGTDGKPIRDVTVTVKGTTVATSTNENGYYTIRASKGQVLVFTYIDHTRKEVTIGDNTQADVTLMPTQQQMEEVVVTAMDIKRNPREISYSAPVVDGAEIKGTSRENFINSLQGRVAGVTVTTTSGNAGASSSIVLRGFNSLSLSNQPLFVIDGVVVDNQTIDENSNGGSGVGLVERGAGLTNTSNRNNDYNNRIADLNPNDIESVTVLKGPEATALYGSQASSGAIIITTRRPTSSKLAIQYDNNFRIQKLTKFPKIFDGYTNGLNGDTSSVFRYYGPAYEPGTKLYNNIDNFFQTGFAQTHNLGVDFGIKKSLFRFSASYFDQEGVIPNNTYNKWNLRLTNFTKFGKFMDITPAISLIHTENNKVLRSAGGFMLALLSWPSINDIRATQGDNGNKLGIFNANAANLDFDNPLFNVNSNKSQEKTDRYNASLSVNIRPTNWLSLAGRFGYETYNTDGYLRYHPLSYYVSANMGGIQDNFWRKYHGYNHTITATAKKTLGKNFNFRVMVGTMWQDYKTEMFAISGSGLVDSIRNGVMYKNGQVVTNANYDALVGSLSDSNVTKVSSRQKLLRNVNGDYNESIIRQIAYFGEFAFNYKNLAFLNFTQRFEEVSTIPKKNRKFNYPGGGISLIISDIFPEIKQSSMNYFKLRGSLAGTARLNSPYSTQSVFVNNLASGGGYSYNFFNNNPELGPEKQSTYEIGTEMRFFKSRLNLDVAYYNTLNKGQIIENFRLSYGTGFVLNTQNAGSTRNRGLEIGLEAIPIKTPYFNYTTRFSFNKMWNKVVEMPKNVSLYYLADANVYGNVAGGIVLGGTTTTISGFGYARTAKGELIINSSTGLPVIDGNQRVRGDRLPDFTLGWNNIFTYKNFRLSFLWDIKVGGDIYNGTKQYLTTIGRSDITADRETPRVIAGVLQDGQEFTDNPTRNTIVVTPYYNDQYYRSMPEEAFIEKDINWMRLKDVTLSYTFPASVTRRVKAIKSLGVFFTATDVFLFTNYSGADPGVNANTAGTRGVGTFGFDYGTLPAQLGLNFGLRASF